MCMLEISLFSFLIAILVLIILTGMNLQKLKTSRESYELLSNGSTCSDGNQCKTGFCDENTKKCVNGE